MRSELEIQKNVQDKLLELELYPFSVIFTYAVGQNDGLLSITFYSEDHLKELLKKLDYQTQCDKTGYIIIEESNTIILTDMALIKFYATLL